MARIRVPRNRQYPSQPNVTSTVSSRYTYGPAMPPMNDDHHHLMNTLWCMTYYFNPQGFSTRYRNFCLFHQRLMAQTTNLLVFEVALREEDFILHHVHNNEWLVQIVDDSLIWQKERLFNIGLNLLPPQCTKIVWLDCDVLFSNNGWIYETSNLLDHFVVVQPYFQNARLPETICSIDHGIDIDTFYYGFGDEQRADGDIHSLFKEKVGQKAWGHPGYAYGYQRSLLEKHGLYDRCITGSSDTLISQAVLGTYENPKIILGHYNEACLKDYLKWAVPFHFDIGMSINFARETDVYHLYHGQTRKRKYFERLKFLKEIDFDYGTELVVNHNNGCYKLAEGNQEIQDWLEQYYIERGDDERENQNKDCDTSRLST